MGRAPIVQLRVYSDDCDAYGHVNQAAFLRLFERARWELLANGPGADVFTRVGSWPAIRRANVEYYAPVFPGEMLVFDLALTHLGRTSMSLHQLARREKDGTLVATGHFLAICIDEQGKPVPVPEALRSFFGIRPAIAGDPVRPIIARGALFAVETTGDGDTILFIHGFPFDRTMWRFQVAGLGGPRRVAPDLRGFGLTDPAPGSWTLADHADDMAALLDEMGIEQAVVCGLSMGGYIAFELWRRHRTRIRALVLANTRAGAESADGRTQRNATIELVRERGSTALVDSMTAKVLAPATLQAQSQVVGHVRTMIADTTTDGMVAALAAMRDRGDSTDLLGSIDVPTLVVGGEEDAVIPLDTQRELARGVSGAELAIIPAAGHLAPLEQPEVFNRILAAFVRRAR